MLIKHLDGNGVGSKRGPEKRPTSVTLSRSPVSAECAAGLPAGGSGSPSLGAPRGGKGGRVCPVTAHMNDSRVRKPLPFLDGFFKPAFIN